MSGPNVKLNRVPHNAAPAETADYADQSHLMREFGSLMGIAPAHLLRDVDFLEAVLGIGLLILPRVPETLARRAIMAGSKCRQ